MSPSRRLRVPFPGPAGYEPAGLISSLPGPGQTGTVPVGVFDLFSIGIGPSSSHTVGPMRAARRFVTTLLRDDLLLRTTQVRSELFGSLGATGHGHGSYNAVLLGLEGADPETVDTTSVDTTSGPLRADEIKRTGQLRLNGTQPVAFDPDD